MDSVLFVDKTIFNLSRDTKKAGPGRTSWAFRSQLAFWAAFSAAHFRRLFVGAFSRAFSAHFRELHFRDYLSAQSVAYII